MPHAERANTASFLEEVIAYVQGLQVGSCSQPLNSSVSLLCMCACNVLLCICAANDQGFPGFALFSNAAHPVLPCTMYEQLQRRLAFGSLKLAARLGSAHAHHCRQPRQARRMQPCSSARRGPALAQCTPQPPASLSQ